MTAMVGCISEEVVSGAWFAESGEALIVYEPLGGRVVGANRRAIGLTGFDEEAIRALTLDRLLIGPAAGPEGLARLAWVARSGGGVVRVREGCFLCPRSGQAVAIRLSASRARGGPHPLGLLAATDFATVPAFLGDGDEAFGRLFGVVSDLCCVAGLDGHFLWVNPAWEEYLGYSADELLRDPIARFLHPADHARIGPGAQARFETRLYHRDGRERRLAWRAESSGGLFYGAARDVTLPARPALDARILVAEDNRENQWIVSLRLTQAGASVTLAPNGRDAVELALAARAAGREFDLVLMDMQMPILDGYEATRLLRDADVRSTIVALTAHAHAEDRLECLKFGCDDHHGKPIDWPALLELIAGHLARARAAS